MSKARKWAQERNFFKMRLMGARTLFYRRRPLVTEQEQQLLDSADEFVRQVLENWNENNQKSKEECLSSKLPYRGNFSSY